MRKDELFDQFDQHFTGDGTEPSPEPIRLIFEWLAIPRLHRPHSEAVDIFIKRTITAVSESTGKSIANAHKSRLIDTLGEYYILRADIYQQMDKNYRIWWDKLMSKIISGGSR